MFNLGILFFISLLTYFLYDVILKKVKNKGKIFLKNIIFIIPVFIMAAIVGFQNNVGTDYNNYIVIFDWVHDFSLIEKAWFEPGFYVLIMIMKNLGFNHEGMFFALAFITYYYIFKSIHYNSYLKFLSIFTFISLTYVYPMTYSGIRQTLAVAIFFYSFKFIKEKKIWKYVLSIFFASLIHKSAIFMLPMYFLVQIKVNRLIVLTSLIVGLINTKLNYIVKPLFFIINNTFYSEYLNADRLVFGSMRVGPQLIIYIFLLIYLIIIKRNIFYHEKEDILLNNYLFYYVITKLALAPLPGLRRMEWYFEVFIILIIPNLIFKLFNTSKININKSLKPVFILLVIIISSLILTKSILFDRIPEYSYKFQWDILY